MSRPRNRANGSLPENLYRKRDKRTGRDYFSYRDPRTGKFHGLGTGMESAITDALALNATIYASIRSAKIAALAVQGGQEESVTFEKVITRHLVACEKRGLAANTIRIKTCTAKAWEAALGKDTPIRSITVRHIVQALDTYNDRPRMRQAMRSAAIDIWKDAIQDGHTDENVAVKTRSEGAEVVRSRLTWDDFQRIHAAALTFKDQWIARSMELALVTAQRREDIASIEFRKTADSSSWLSDDSLYVIQHKTGNKVCIPLSIGIKGFSLSGVVRACRQDNVVSRWLIHHQRPRTLSKPGDQVWVDTISRGFARARDMAGITVESGKTPPSFHEIRSLSIRLYAEEHGPEFAQAIAGHKDASMTAIYRDTRGSEWVKISV